MATRRCEEDLGGISLKQLLSFQGSVMSNRDPILWFPDSSGILFKSMIGGRPNIWRADPKTATLERLTVDLGTVPFIQNSSLMDLSPDRCWISYVGDKSGGDGREHSSRVEIWLQPTEGGAEVQLTSLGAHINSYSWSSDGRSIVLSSNRYGRYDIFKVDVPSGKSIRLTDDILYEVYPVFTPSGEHILYVRMDNTWADHEVILMTVDGEKVSTVTKDTGFFDYILGRKFGFPLVSPAGDTVVFPSHRSGWINYWQVPLEGGEPKPVHAEESDQSEAAFSPDGLSLAFVSSTNGTSRLTVVPMNDDMPRVLVNPELGVVSKPAWSADGEKLAYVFQSPTSPGDLWEISVKDGVSRQLTRAPLSHLLKNRLTNPEKISYQSFDDREISAYLYAPPERKPGDRHPALFIVHGGPTNRFSDTYYPEVQYFIRKGYVVLMPNIRGSTGYGREFEHLNNRDWGHDDLRDVVAGIDFLKGLDYVDVQNVGIYGKSYGGCMSMSAVCFAPGVFQAAVPHAGYGDWVDMAEQQEKRHVQLMRYEFGDFQENREVYERCSPIYRIADVTTPVFLVHGEGRYPSSDASFKFARALEREYKTYEYKVYPNECYYVESEANLRELWPDIVDFLDRYLKR